MRIITLGTSHGDSTFNRFNSSTLYETSSGRLYLVDAGAPCEALIRRKGLNIKDLKAVFITHMHDDHAGGLSGLIKQTTKYGKERSFDLKIYLPESRAINALKEWVKVLHENAEDSILDYCSVTDGEIYSDDELTVTAIRTKHLRTISRTEGDPCSFAYVLDFKKENKKILHSGDLWIDFSDFPKIALEEHFDLCLLEATHYKPAVAAEILKDAKFDRLIFVHVFDKWHIRVYDGWKTDNGDKDLLEYYKSLPYPVSISHDGDEFLL